MTYQPQHQFQNIDLLPQYTLVPAYLETINIVLNKALTEYPRTLVVRFDLHMPAIPNCIDFPIPDDFNVISRFIDSLKAQVKADLIKKQRENIRVHNCRVRFVWVKERNDAQQPHYHVAIFLNKDTYHTLGEYLSFGNNLSSKIQNAWASALKVEFKDIIGLVHFPQDTPLYYLDVNAVNYEGKYHNVFKRLSYLAKIETKQYGSGRKNIGCSFI